MHFVGREDADMSELHTANVLQTSDVVRSAQAGLVIGGAAGTVLGIGAAFFSRSEAKRRNGAWLLFWLCWAPSWVHGHLA